ncbi:right-handed parallel beta-helix repeat-containing protein [Planctomycetota bacterium]
MRNHIAASKHIGGGRLILLLVGAMILTFNTVCLPAQVSIAGLQGTLESQARGAGTYGLTVFLTDANGKKLEPNDLSPLTVRIIPDLWMGSQGTVAYFSPNKKDPNDYDVQDGSETVTISRIDRPDLGFTVVETESITIKVTSAISGQISMLLEVVESNTSVTLDSGILQVVPIVTNVDTWYVDVNHKWPYQDGTENAPFIRINDALAVAKENNTIVIVDGEYDEILTLSIPGLVLKKEGFEDDDIKKPIVETGVVLRSNGGRALTIDLADKNQAVFIKGLSICPLEGVQAGGIECKQGTVTLTGCYISGNYAENDGGGIHVAEQGIADIQFCTFLGNIAANMGGGIYAASGSGLEIKSCNIFRNHAQQQGGGLYGHAHIKGDPFKTGNEICSVFSGNTADSQGSAMYFSDGDSSLKNCIIEGHKGIDKKAALFAKGTKLEIVQCTFYGNRSTATSGYALRIDDSVDEVDIRNSIFWEEEQEERQITIVPYPFAKLNKWSIGHSDIWGLGTVTDASGLFGKEPLFLRKGEWQGTQWERGDYHLKAQSPCIDTGDSTVPEGYGDDPPINIGAYAGTNEAGSK